MSSALDIAAYILDRQPSSPLSLQKLLYYADVWCRLETGRGCFAEAIEAWRNGPVVPVVWRAFREGRVEALGDSGRVLAAHAEVIDDVLAVYGPRGAQELVEATHAEPGWLIARRGLSPADRGSAPIELELVVEYLRAVGTGDRRGRMRAALDRSRERAQLRQVLEPHRQTMLRLAQ